MDTGQDTQGSTNEVTENSHGLTENAFHVARNAGFLTRPFGSWTVTALAAGLLLGLVGATGSYDYSLPVRLALWIPLCLVAGLIGLAIEALLTRLMLHRRGWLAWWSASSLTMAVLMFPIVFFVNSLSGQSPLPLIPLYILNCVIISAGFVALRMIVGLSVANTYGRGFAEPGSAETPAIMARLKPELREAQLLALKSEGHYVLIHTDRGDELVLLRFSDALLETGGVEGMQVHRSWWIARQAYEKSRREGEALLVTLTNGVEVPISRTYRAEWRQAAW